jgi:arylsulfatase A-like enzyme
MMTRRQFLTGAAGSALLGCQSKGPQPNILFLMPDQFRGMDIGVMGNTDVHTPNIDSLAAQGVVFRNAIANSPVCCPARGTLLTGRFAHHHGVAVNDAPLPNEEITVAEILKERGYRTGFVGKWHLEGGKREPGYVPPGPRRQGFDFWAAHICSHDYWNMHYFRDDPDPIPIEGYSDTTFTDEALRFLNQDKESPFCLYV